MKKNLSEELYDSIKSRMNDASTEELKELREHLIKSGKMTNELLELFNEELLDRVDIGKKNK